jgi:hypothetical protein
MGRNLHWSLIFASEEVSAAISALLLLRLHSDGRSKAFPAFYARYSRSGPRTGAKREKAVFD